MIDMRLTEHELQKLRAKYMDLSKKPEERNKNAQILAKLFMRRHGVDPAKYNVWLEDGSIRERVKE